MKLIIDYLRELFECSRKGWDRFWFTPRDPATLGLVRLFAGAMLLYTHLVWTLDLDGFFGADGRIPVGFARSFFGSAFAWSHYEWIHSRSLVWLIHWAALASLLMFTIGLFTRVTSVLAFLTTVSYVHRVPGTLFGLDQINALLAMYLMIGPSGAAYSMDRIRDRRRGVEPRPESVSANVAIRLIQVHMCIIYLFAGTGKLLGDSWWDGTAMWGALANYEYQSLDMTWLASWPLVVNALTHVTVAWEVSYCVLVWPRLTRPLVVALAVPLHLGIAVCMGMITFGLVMLIANLAFVSPSLVRRLLGGASSEGRGGEGR